MHSPAAAPAPIDATPFIQVAAPRGHKPRFGKHPRVMLSGATVDVSTLRQIKTWMGKTVSRGILLDQLVAFGLRRKFTPKRK